MSDEKKIGSLGEGVARFLRPIARREEPKPEPKKPEKTKRVFSVWFEPEVVRQLKFIAAETEKTQQALMNEAMNMLFKKYGKPEIA